MKKKIEKPRSKRREFVVEGTKFQFVPFSDENGIGYVRLEKRGEYIYSFDGRKRNHKFLRHLRAVISDWLKE